MSEYYQINKEPIRRHVIALVAVICIVLVYSTFKYFAGTAWVGCMILFDIIWVMIYLVLVYGDQSAF